MTAEYNETQLLKSLIWSTNSFSLAEFVDKYELPQVVCVEIGYFGDDENSTLSSGQVLTLHCLEKTAKVVCESPTAGVVVIPLECPFKFRVLPKDCDRASFTAEQLASLYSSTKYIRVVKSQKSKDNSEKSFDVDDILKVQDAKAAKGFVKCSNVARRQNVLVPLNCDALFSPLLDPGEHTLAEVKKRFGFPAKVSLSDDKNGNRRSSYSNDSCMSVSSLGTLTIHRETEDYVVISTTMCETGQKKVCLQIPKDLEITVVVAEGFMSGNETYQRVVRTMDKNLNRTSLKDFKDLNVYEHLDVVKNSVQTVDLSSAMIGSARVEKLVREDRARQFTPGPSPEIPLRFPTKPMPPAPDPSWSPIVPPRIKPAPKSPQSQSSTSGVKVFENLTRGPFSRDWLRKKVSRAKSEGHEPEYVKPVPKPSEIYEETENYTALDPTCQSPENFYHSAEVSHPTPPKPPNMPPPPPPMPPSNQVIYDDPLPKAPHTAHQGKTLINPPLQVPQSDKEEIYRALACFPQDISRLTTAEVGKLLTYLGMKCYVSKFDFELIDGEMLESMDKESLESMDKESLESLEVKSFHAKKLLKFIGGWRPNI